MKKLFLLFACLFCSLGFAEPLDDLNQLLVKFHTVQASFQQTVKSDQGNVLQKSTGVVVIQRPGKLRWDKQKPLKQLVIINNDRVQIYDPDLEQVTERSFSGDVGDAPALLLAGEPSAIEKSFVVKAMPSSRGKQNFKLTSKEQSSVTPVILLTFKAGKIYSMQLQDNLGHVTDVRFSNVVLNESINSSLFALKIPSGVDVIRE